MTNPPQGSDEQGGAAGRPAPQQQPYGAPSYGQPPYAAPAQPPPSYGPPSYGPPSYGPPSYGPPQPSAAPYGQPPYGQPPYSQPAYGAPGQPPYAAPAQKSRVGLIIGVTAGIVALIAVVVLALTLGGTVLDKSAVERDVAAQFEQREGVAIDLRCAEDMKVAKGSHYECSGTTADGENVTLRITVTDETTAAYTWTEP
jgi:hypothetical protein